MNDLTLIQKFERNKLTTEQRKSFDKRIQNDADFAKLYTDLLIDESLMKDALNELSITGDEPLPNKSSKPFT